MKHYSGKVSFLTISALGLALCTLHVNAQTPDARNPNSDHYSGSAAQEHATNAVSSNRSSRETPGRFGTTAKDLMGKSVESKNGDKLGLIKDLAIDTRSGRVA